VSSGSGLTYASGVLAANAASTTVPGIVQLSDSVSTTSSTVAATATAVKAANDLAASKVAKSGDTISGNLAVQGNLTATGNVTGVRWGDLQFKPTTDAIPEGAAAKYYSDARARLALSSGSGLAYNSASGVLAANAASTSFPGVVQLTDSVSTTSSTLAATATAVKAASDLAASKVAKSGDTITGNLAVQGTLTATGNVMGVHWGDLQFKPTTDAISEGTTSKYFTDARARAAMSTGVGLTYDSTSGTMALAAGAIGPTSTTQAGLVQLNDTLSSTSTSAAATANTVQTLDATKVSRAGDTISGNLAVQGNLTATGNVLGVRWGDLQFKPTTDAIPEGAAAKYYTDTRARAAVTAGTGLAYDSRLGVLTANTASATLPGVVQLSDSVSTTSSTLAATATAVKAANDLAASKVSKAGGDTISGALTVSGALTAPNLTVGPTSNLYNVLSFAGISGDPKVATFVAERLYNLNGSNQFVMDFSELLLCKLNDASGTVGPDRIRHVAAAHKFQTYINSINPLANYTTDLLDSKFIDAMYITPDACVGIRTTAPAYPLDVSGDARVSSLYVMGNASITGNVLGVHWSDIADRPATTDNIPQGANNLYYTTARATSDARAAVSVGGTGLAYAAASGQFTANAASISQPGVVQLTDSVSTTSSTLAATATAVKAAYDLAASKLNTAGGSVTGDFAVQGTLTATGNVMGVRWGDVQFKPTTNSVPEGTNNLYYTAARTTSDARAAVSVGGTGLAYTAASGQFTANAASTTLPGIVQLSDSTNTASSTLAATATAVKAAYDLATSRVSKAGDTVTGVLSVSPPAAANALVVTENLVAARVYKRQDKIRTPPLCTYIHTYI
jgi:cytoskeletal protein CcmA (bactofilin family)